MSPTERRDDPTITEKQHRFMALLLPLRDRLVRFARSMARTPEDAEDLVADTILAAFERFDTVKSPEAFLSYLFTIASRIHRQRVWRRRLFGSYDEEEAAMKPHRGTAPDTAVDILILRRALTQLPEKQRETLVLFEISGLSLEEVRQVQGGSLSGVKSRLTRGRERLAELLVDAGTTARSTAQNANDEDPSLTYIRSQKNG